MPNYTVTMPQDWTWSERTFACEGHPRGVLVTHAPQKEPIELTDADARSLACKGLLVDPPPPTEEPKAKKGGKG